MVVRCPVCGGSPAVGILCQDCAGALPRSDGLIADHLASTASSGEAAGCLIDGFGRPHPVPTARTIVGRRPQAGLVILHGSVSRDHAELHRDDDGWRVRDLGSRNATFVDGQRVEGRAAVPDRAQLRFGDVALWFVGHPIAAPHHDPGSAATGQPGGGAVRFTLRGADVELCLLTPRNAPGDAGGALLYRRAATAAWAEMSLPPLEFQLLRVLCLSAAAEASSPARTRGCVATKQLARDLPFQTRYANEENVRQVVRRIRATLDEVGAGELVAAAPGRGYYLAWPIVVA